jgi:hypothetical protein
MEKVTKTHKLYNQYEQIHLTAKFKVSLEISLPGDLLKVYGLCVCLSVCLSIRQPGPSFKF